ncbi:hypothetical protein LY76DRAFT_180494 [Colletotrichum caudatum]|nr:hypothetical protein LY76DRAFT_180494 [Colletotrichum caudatum]
MSPFTPPRRHRQRKEIEDICAFLLHHHQQTTCESCQHWPSSRLLDPVSVVDPAPKSPLVRCSLEDLGTIGGEGGGLPSSISIRHMSAHGRATDSLASVSTCHPLSLHRKMLVRFISVSCLRNYMRRQHSSQGRNASPGHYYSSHSVWNQSKERDGEAGEWKTKERKREKRKKKKPHFKPTQARGCLPPAKTFPNPAPGRPLASNVRPSRRASNNERPRHLDVPLAPHAAASRSPLSVHRACGPALPNSPHTPMPAKRPPSQVVGIRLPAGSQGLDPVQNEPSPSPILWTDYTYINARVQGTGTE